MVGSFVSGIGESPHTRRIFAAVVHVELNTFGSCTAGTSRVHHVRFQQGSLYSGNSFRMYRMLLTPGIHLGCIRGAERNNGCLRLECTARRVIFPIDEAFKCDGRSEGPSRFSENSSNSIECTWIECPRCSWCGPLFFLFGQV